MLRVRFFLCFLALLAAGPALAGRPHDHGAARLDIAVAGGRVSITFDTPLHNLLGFERAPRTDAERERVDAVLTQLRAADRIFRIDSAASCTLAKVELVSAALQPGGATAAPGRGEHADLEGRYDYDCANGERAGFVETGLFGAFKGLARIEVQAATPKGQMKFTLRRPASRVALVR